MPNRAARRAAMREQQKKLAAVANSADAVAAVASDLLPTAFDFQDEEDDALSLLSNPLSLEKPFAAAAGPAVESEPAASAPTPIPTTHPPLSDARLAANRANAQHSSGPRSQIGKSKSSLNAVKTGLTGQTVVLPSDDAAAY